MENDRNKIPTKQKILECATDLFAEKGYTETSIRELAAAVGLKEASIYNHFLSKNAILESILEEYSELTRAAFEPEQLNNLKNNPSADGILSCMQLVFKEGKEKYHLQQLYVILQEQHRNPTVGKFLSDHFILGNENVVKEIINILKDYGVLKQDTDPDYWAKIHSSLLYTFASRMKLGIGDQSKEFKGLNMADMLWQTYDMMLKLYGNKTIS